MCRLHTTYLGLSIWCSSIRMLKKSVNAQMYFIPFVRQKKNWSLLLNHLHKDWVVSPHLCLDLLKDKYSLYGLVLTTLYVRKTSKAFLLLLLLEPQLIWKWTYIIGLWPLLIVTFSWGCRYNCTDNTWICYLFWRGFNKI